MDTQTFLLLVGMFLGGLGFGLYNIKTGEKIDKLISLWLVRLIVVGIFIVLFLSFGAWMRAFKFWGSGC